ncbi:hypothetical protein AKJ16_DCAP21691 [Drosera capensis]
MGSKSDGSQHFDNVKPLISTVRYGGVFQLSFNRNPKASPLHVFPFIHRLRFRLIVDFSRLNNLKLNIVETRESP